MEIRKSPFVYVPINNINCSNDLVRHNIYDFYSVDFNLPTEKNNSEVIDYTEFCKMLPVDPSPQCKGVFAWYDFDKTRLNSMELFTVLANFTGAGKEDKQIFNDKREQL